jgi:cell division protein FtsQ
MDGQRRIAQSLTRLSRSSVARRVTAIGLSRGTGFLVRSVAVSIIGLSLLAGFVQGEHFEREGSAKLRFGDTVAGMLGLAAVNVSITGLSDHEPEQLLKALGLVPGASLIGFDAGQAKRLLEGIDWVEQASIQRRFPNQLEINITERTPFAVWQRGRAHYVIDRHGIAMSGIDSSRVEQLPLVSGEGANLAVEELVNELEATPELLLRVGAAARVGQRRWTLYLDNGVKILLPEAGTAAALNSISSFDKDSGILSKPITEVDLRIPNQMRVAMVQTDGFEKLEEVKVQSQ